MTDPIATIDRFEQLTSLIEKRIYDHTQEFDTSKSVRQWLMGLHADTDLKVWDRERMNMLQFIPLGYFWEQQ